jgi:hypothetical protein
MGSLSKVFPVLLVFSILIFLGAGVAAAQTCAPYCAPPACGPSSGLTWSMLQPPPPPPIPVPSFNGSNCGPRGCAPPQCGGSSWLGDLNMGLFDLFRGGSGSNCGW